MIVLGYGYWYNTYGYLPYLEYFNERNLTHKIENIRISGRDLTQKPFAHSLKKLEIWEVEIGADEIITKLKEKFLQDFFCANLNYFGYYKYNQWFYNYVFVREDKEFPKSITEDVERVKFNLEETKL